MNKRVDMKNLNEVIALAKKILKIVFVFLILGVIFLVWYLCKEIKIFEVIGKIFALCSPLFIGLIIAWLLDPIVTFLTTKKIKRPLASVIVFIAFLLIIFLLISLLMPVLASQINEFARQVPSLFLEVGNFIHEMFQKITNLGIDLSNLEANVYDEIEVFGSNLASSLPSLLINYGTKIVSSVGSLVLAIIISFYLLLDFPNVNKFYNFVPVKFRDTVKDITARINGTFRDFVQGLFLIALIVAVISSVGYGLVGLPSPLLFGILCGITNIIPYIGPWIGGGICVIVGFTISPLCGILTIIVAVVVQQVDNVILEPIIYGKAVKLHPITIMLGLLIFGYFFGVFGMILSAPIIACLKVIFEYFNEKYGFLNAMKGKAKVKVKE